MMMSRGKSEREMQVVGREGVVEEGEGAGIEMRMRRNGEGERVS